MDTVQRLICLVSAVFCWVGCVLAQPGGCSPPTASPNCTAATVLTPGAACVSGTTCAGGVQGASTCLYAGSQCSWYRFTATAANMFVNIAVTTTSGCHISSNVYAATGNCTGLAQISCQFGAPLDDVHSLTGLTVGGIYFVQVCYAPGGPCGNGGTAQFCISVGVPAPPCNTCSSPCGTASGYTSTPTVQQVVADCNTTPFSPALQAGTSHSFCYAFTATNTSVNFNVVITSNCSGGNVTAFSWSLFNSPACGGAIQTGTLSNLTFTGLTVGNTYVYCYTFTVPTGCTHSQHCPYFVGAVIPLAVRWLSVEARVVDRSAVEVEWTTAAERNSDLFVVERSKDGELFDAIGTVPAAGESHTVNRYLFTDHTPCPGLSYYRIEELDMDGSTDRSATVAVLFQMQLMQPLLYPNPVTASTQLTFRAVREGPVWLELYDAHASRIMYFERLAREGNNRLEMPFNDLPAGLYFLSISAGNDREQLRFVKE
jgi:hypothetical protein